MPELAPVTAELDVDVAAMLREHAAVEHVSEVGQIRDRSDLDEEAAMRLVTDELTAVRAARRPRAA